MDAIDRIIEEINQKASSQREQQERLKTAELTEQLATEKAQALKEHEQQLAKQMDALKSKYKQLHARQQVEVKQATLKAKQSYLERLFTESYQSMADWSEAEHREFASNALQALSDISGQAVLRPGGQMNPAVFDQAWVNTQNADLNYELTLGEALADQTAGFIVDVQGVYYNFLYRDLLNEIRQTDSHEITQKLFGN